MSKPTTRADRSSRSAALSNSQACSPPSIHGAEPVRAEIARRRAGRWRPTAARGNGAGGAAKRRCRKRHRPPRRSSPALPGPSASSSTPEPVAQERAVGGAVGQRQRVEPGRLAGADAVVAPADPAHEQLGAAVLVEQHGARGELLRLRGEEVHHHRLARARRADDREIAEVAVVEVEEERRRAGGLEQGHRLAPVVALGLAERRSRGASRSSPCWRWRSSPGARGSPRCRETGPRTPAPGWYPRAPRSRRCRRARRRPPAVASSSRARSRSRTSTVR